MFQSAARCFVLLIAMSIASSASAHFVWLFVGSMPQSASTEATTTEKPVTMPAADKLLLTFGEVAAPGEAHLIDKVAKTAGYIYPADSVEATEVKWEKWTAGDEAAWTSALPQPAEWRGEVVCDYGVLTKGGQTFLLQYYAKTIQAAEPRRWSSLAKAEKIPLDITPELRGKTLRLKITWQGKPATGAKLVFQLPGDKSGEVVANDQGFAEVPLEQAGQFAVRVNHDEKVDATERDGKSFELIKHHSTLCLNVSAAELTAAESGAAANELLKQARQNRAVWERFPGAAAKVNFSLNGQHHAADFQIDDSGSVTNTMPEGAAREWLETYLASVVQHRLPDGIEGENVQVVSEEQPHPLGTKISLGDAKLDSHYRVRDGMVREVNRRMGPGRFTISVIDTSKNTEGKYLPAIFTFNLFNKTGELTSTLTEHNTWQRVGRFDLPWHVMRVGVTKNQHEIQVLDFADWRILPEKTAGSK